jgi:hypothetical protein
LQKIFEYTPVPAVSWYYRFLTNILAKSSVCQCIEPKLIKKIFISYQFSTSIVDVESFDGPSLAAVSMLNAAIKIVRNIIVSRRSI